MGGRYNRSALPRRIGRLLGARRRAERGGRARAAHRRHRAPDARDTLGSAVPLYAPNGQGLRSIGIGPFVFRPSDGLLPPVDGTQALR